MKLLEFCIKPLNKSCSMSEALHHVVISVLGRQFQFSTTVISLAQLAEYMESCESCLKLSIKVPQSNQSVDR